MCLCQLIKWNHLICDAVASNLDGHITVRTKVVVLIYDLHFLNYMVIIVRLCDLISATVSDTGRLDRKDTSKRHA